MQFSHVSEPTLHCVRKVMRGEVWENFSPIRKVEKLRPRQPSTAQLYIYIHIHIYEDKDKNGRVYVNICSGKILQINEHVA